jgi:hypothetical protein
MLHFLSTDSPTSSSILKRFRNRFRESRIQIKNNDYHGIQMHGKI